MRRPHVFERSAPRAGRDAFHEPANRASTARLLAAQLGNMIERAHAAGLTMVVIHLEQARLEAERTVDSLMSTLPDRGRDPDPPEDESS